MPVLSAEQGLQKVALVVLISFEEPLLLRFQLWKVDMLAVELEVFS